MTVNTLIFLILVNFDVDPFVALHTSRRDFNSRQVFTNIAGVTAMLVITAMLII